AVPAGLHWKSRRAEQHGVAWHQFQHRDADNDNCLCKLVVRRLSNLNGIHYTVGHNIRKLNGIKWHHFRGPSYSLHSTAMMI
ncbi:unnamed protein product, partial [Coregonus sp. 'balchen']